MKKNVMKLSFMMMLAFATSMTLSSCGGNADHEEGTEQTDGGKCGEGKCNSGDTDKGDKCNDGESMGEKDQKCNNGESSDEEKKCNAGE